MDKGIREIIDRQQELEHIKLNCKNKGNFGTLSSYGKKILMCCRHMEMSQLFSDLVKLFLVLITVSIFWQAPFLLFGIAVGFVSETDSNVKIDTNTPLGAAEMEIKKGNYESARSILVELMEENPNNSGAVMDYAKLCQLEGKHDEAANTLIDFISGYYETQNVLKGNMLYILLQELEGPFSPETEKARKECLEACGKAAENFEALDMLIKDGNYTEVVSICNSLKDENVADSRLCYYFYKSYMELGEYEKCADYLISIADKWEFEENRFSPILPWKSELEYKLNELRPYVSDSTQIRIDDTIKMLKN